MHRESKSLSLKLTLANNKRSTVPQYHSTHVPYCTCTVWYLMVWQSNILRSFFGRTDARYGNSASTSRWVYEVTYFICLTIVLFPDSPAPETERREKTQVWEWGFFFLFLLFVAIVRVSPRTGSVCTSPDSRHAKLVTVFTKLIATLV